MTLLITLAWWHIPTAITVVALLFMLFWPAVGTDKLFLAVLWLIVALAAWAIAGALK